MPGAAWSSCSNEGKVRAIGGSNFKPAHIDRLIEATGVAPHVDQVQLQPLHRARGRARLPRRPRHRSPKRGRPSAAASDLLQDPLLADIAGRHGKTPAQVVLRWHVQQGMVPIPKSSNPQRLAENIDVFSFELTDAEMASISGLDKGGEGAVDSDRMGH